MGQQEPGDQSGDDRVFRVVMFMLWTALVLFAAFVVKTVFFG